MRTNKPMQETSPLKKLRLVLDTNIVMDMLHFADRSTAPLLEAIESGQIDALTDPECLAELQRVLTYPEFGLSSAEQAALFERYKALTTSLPAAPCEQFILPRCRDSDDQKFLILAARAGADLLVTRDKLLLRLARHRLTPPPCPIIKADETCRRLGLSS